MSFDAQVVALGEALRAEGVAIGTSELNDAFAALEQVPWTAPRDFREALAATLAKSPEDRRIFDLVFDRFVFRAAEAQAVSRDVREAGDADAMTGGERIELDNLREQLLQAIRDGDEAAMRDLARLAIAALGRRGEGSGVLGVDVQRIRRALGLRSEPSAQFEEDVPILLGLGERRRERLAEVLPRGPAHRVESLEGVEQLGRAHGHTLGPQLVGELEQARRHPGRPARRRHAAVEGRISPLAGFRRGHRPASRPRAPPPGRGRCGA